MADLNQITLVGRLGADPEVKRTSGGMTIANMRLATSERWTDKQSGQKKEVTQWHTVVCFNENLCKVIEQYAKKGSRLLVQGQMEYRTWEKQDGGKGYASEVAMRFDSKLILLDGRDGSGGGGGGRDYDREAADRGRAVGNQSSGGQPSRASASLDDDIPF